LKHKCAIFLLLFCTLALADGGKVLLRQESGLFAITVFLTASDMSVLVQDRITLQPVLDAEVVIRIGDTWVKATHENAQNKLLYAAALPAGETGESNFTVDVNHGTTASGTLNIAPAAPMLATNWEYVAVPPVFILLFAIREWLVRRRRRTDILVR
jgi:hypothetical protein